MTFEIITTVVVLIIFVVFHFYAQKAEKVVAAQAKARLAHQEAILAAKATLSKKTVKSNNQSKSGVVV